MSLWTGLSKTVVSKCLNTGWDNNRFQGGTQCKRLDPDSPNSAIRSEPHCQKLTLTIETAVPQFLNRRSDTQFRDRTDPSQDGSALESQQKTA
jgi:hypothetical protein